MRVVATLLLLLATCPTKPVLGADSPTVSKVAIGRQTAYFDGPLDKTGEIDYETALNERLRGKITPEQNVNALLVQAFGPVPDSSTGRVLPDRFFQWLQIPVPPVKGNYFVSIMPDEQPPSPEELWELVEKWSRAGEAPWKEADLPMIAAWLRANEKPLALAVAASRRDQYYNPVVRPHGQRPDQGGVISLQLPNVSMTRDVASALKVRAMLRLGQGVPDEAWDDLLAAHRLARFVSQGAMLVDHLAGLYIEEEICAAELVYLEKCPLSSRQLRRRLHDLQNLPPFGRLADKIDVGERVWMLDTLRQIRRGKVQLSKFFPKKEPLTAEQKHELANLDWVEIQRGVNRWHDRIVAAWRITDREARERDWDELKQVLLAPKGPGTEYESVNKFFEKVPGKSPTEAFRDRSLHLFSSTLINLDSTNRRQDHIEQNSTNLRIGIAVVIYHREHKRYPAQLEDLVPAYLASIPLDFFSGKPLVYRRTKEGFFFYSVGQNGKDDGGYAIGEGDPDVDDIRFRIDKLLPAFSP